MNSPSSKICNLLDQYFSDIEIIEEKEAIDMDKNLYKKLKTLIQEEIEHKPSPSLAHIRLLMHVITALCDHEHSTKLMVKIDIISTMASLLKLLLQQEKSYNEEMWRLAMLNFLTAVSCFTDVQEGMFNPTTTI